MKKSLIKGLLFSTILAFTACNENDNDVNVYNGNDFISFGTQTTAGASESSTDPITITAYASVANVQSDFTVDTEITFDNASAANYTLVDGKSSFNFGPGKLTDTIQIIPVGNFEEDGSKVITFTLSSASNGVSLGIPSEGGAKSFSVTISDDDCALKAEDFIGAPSGTEVTGSRTYNTKLTFKQDPDNASSSSEVNLLMSGNIQEEYMTDVWSEAIVQSWDIPVKLDLTDPSSPKVVFGNNAAADMKNYNGAPTAVANYTDANNDGNADWAYGVYVTDALAPNATYSTCDNTLYFEYIWIVTQAPNADFGNFNGGPLKVVVSLTFGNDGKIVSQTSTAGPYVKK